MAGKMKTELILRDFHMAIGSQSIAPGQLTIPSDRGIQYASEETYETMKLYGILHGIKMSMLRRGKSWDHSTAEIFFASPKKEKPYRLKYPVREEARAALFNYIENWSNLRHLHPSIGFDAPLEYKSDFFEMKWESTYLE